MSGMLNPFLSLLLAASVSLQSPEPPPTQARGIALSDFNIRIESDVRTLVVMAALNAGGFDYETGGQPLSPARAELRRDLADIDTGLKEKLAAFYKSHRRPGTDEGADALRYAALSLLMQAPPSFEIYQPVEIMPEDLRALMEGGELVTLIREFYLTSNFKRLLPKYTAVANAYGAAYRQPVTGVVYEVLNYFHATPETLISMRPLVIESGDAGGRGGKKKQQVYTRNRSRSVLVVPDPLSAINVSLVRDDILNQKDDLLSRRIGDDYIVVTGPSKVANTDACRQAIIRFLIDPIVERHLKPALEYKEQITGLVAKVPTAGREFGPSVYLVIRESLARAAEARIRRMRARENQDSYTEDEAVFDLAQAYLRGAVLSFHFYDSLIGLEKVGISIEDFVDQMIATTRFDREADRPRVFEPVVARVSAARRTAHPSAPPANPAEVLAGKILASNDLIGQRRFAEARKVLDEVLAVAPGNARALFGMAQVVNQIPTDVETDPKADENDKIQAQHDRLEQALKLFRRAIESASAESEAWLIQWSHVMMGRILDFQDFRADAVAEYEKAIAFGEIPNGAYKEALQGKETPYRPR